MILDRSHSADKAPTGPTTDLIDEPRWHEILPALRRAALIADYLAPTATLATPTEPEVKP